MLLPPSYVSPILLETGDLIHSFTGRLDPLVVTGDPYDDPTRMLPNKADGILAAAYEVVATHIRAVSQSVLLFFAGVTWDRTGDWEVHSHNWPA